MANIEVNVWSDVACPWCWVGLQRFKRAVARVSDRATVEAKFHPYMIDPATRKTGATKDTFKVSRVRYLFVPQ